MNIRMKNLILILAIITSSCSIASPDYVYSVDKELEPYYFDFIQDSKDNGLDFRDVSIIMSLEDLDGEVALTVNRGYKTINKIQIDRAIWNESNESKKKYIIYHEMGHAFLGLEDNEYDNMSIMRTKSNISITNFRHYEKQMISKLFE